MLLDDRLNNGDLIILDGATGSELENFGATLDPVVWCGAANLEYPDSVLNVHEAYIHAGADVITTNTFATCRHVLDGAGLGERAVEINQRATELALRARDNVANGREIAIAGSLSTMYAWVPGKTAMTDPRFVPNSREVLAENLLEQAQTLTSSGVDFLILEMMFNVDTDILLAELAKETGLPIWVGLSASLNSTGEVVPFRSHHSLHHENAQTTLEFSDLIKAFVNTSPQVMGIMHSTVPATPPALTELTKLWTGPVMVYPETIHTLDDGEYLGNYLPPDLFAKECEKMVKNGIQIIGGCCGTTIAHINALTEILDRKPSH